MERYANKEIVLEFYRQIIRDRKSELIDDFIHDNYIQHSPSLKEGKDALREAIEYLKKLPKPEVSKPPYVIAIEDGEFVILLLDLVFTTRKNVADVFKLKDGKVIEHWDAIQDHPQNEAPEDLLDIVDLDRTNSNKNLIRDFFESIIRRDLKLKLLKEDYVEHNHDVRSSGLRLDAYLSDVSLRKNLSVHRIFGEGNVVVAQTKATRLDLPLVCYDFFRITDNTIVEHWSVEQRIPDSMPHHNGMI